MTESYVVTGTLTDPRTVALDEPLPAGTHKVRLVIEPLEPKPKRPLDEVLTEIHERLRQSGHQPPTKEEVDAYIREERDSWNER